ncbi:hypothetical protein [Phytohabitans suffuscus]|uniref:Uncharacterized protein n=1 Tax=Phytohabitans suffuscus TaxID=624315 RepID=A0A6F8YJR3_9ACTN|nr:hypothetical protein [Phytohabitans suffuscus]BCB86316.1 hypothetical protein Psuf_036290 [Phytohabitans suffuscus]
MEQAPAPTSAPPVSTSPEYGEWARDQRGKGGEPAPGTVYGASGSEPPQMTMAIAGGSPLENSGSLTGHILSQGRSDGPAQSANTAKVFLVMALVLGILVAVGALVVLVTGDTFSDLFDSFLKS